MDIIAKECEKCGVKCEFIERIYGKLLCDECAENEQIKKNHRAVWFVLTTVIIFLILTYLI